MDTRTETTALAFGSLRVTTAVGRSSVPTDAEGRCADDYGEDARALVPPAFESALRPRNRSPRTIRSYLDTAELLAAFCDQTYGSSLLDEMTAEQVNGFIADQLARWAPSTAATRFRCLQQFFRYAARSRASPRPCPVSNLPGSPTRPSLCCATRSSCACCGRAAARGPRPPRPGHPAPAHRRRGPARRARGDARHRHRPRDATHPRPRQGRPDAVHLRRHRERRRAARLPEGAPRVSVPR